MSITHFVPFHFESFCYTYMYGNLVCECLVISCPVHTWESCSEIIMSPFSKWVGFEQVEIWRSVNGIDTATMHFALSYDCSTYSSVSYKVSCSSVSLANSFWCWVPWGNQRDWQFLAMILVSTCFWWRVERISDWTRGWNRWVAVIGPLYKGLFVRIALEHPLFFCYHTLHPSLLSFSHSIIFLSSSLFVFFLTFFFSSLLCSCLW